MSRHIFGQCRGSHFLEDIYAEGVQLRMTPPNKNSEDRQDGRTGKQAKPHDKDPEWADGLRKLYDSVVDEPIPDAFKDLLQQFDESDSGKSQGNGA